KRALRGFLGAQPGFVIVNLECPGLFHNLVAHSRHGHRRFRTGLTMRKGCFRNFSVITRTRSQRQGHCRRNCQECGAPFLDVLAMISSHPEPPQHTNLSSFDTSTLQLATFAIDSPKTLDSSSIFCEHRTPIPATTNTLAFGMGASIAAGIGAVTVRQN